MSGCTPTLSPAAGADAPQAENIVISPLSRVNGAYSLSAAVQGGVLTEARLGSDSYQGLEFIVQGREPLDAVQFMQRLAGADPVAQAVAAAFALDQICGSFSRGGARAMRNLMQAAAIVLSHLTHFYRQALPDYIYQPGGSASGPRAGQRLDQQSSAEFMAGAAASAEQVRLCHELIAVFGARSPQPQSIMAGGVSGMPTREGLLAFLERLRKLRRFVEASYLPQVYRLAAYYRDSLFSLGQGYRAAISLGGLPLTDNHIQQVFKPGVYSGGKIEPMDPRRIKLFTRYARFDTAATGQPFNGLLAAPQPEKREAYSFTKAARYDGQPLESGPLARMWISNPGLSAVGRQQAAQSLGVTAANFRDLGEGAAFSLMGRHIARAEECLYLLPFMERWLKEIVPGQPTLAPAVVPQEGEGLGFTESPQGALLHYVSVKGGLVDKYRVITPDMWNASPQDDLGQRGPIEEALIGAPVPDAQNPANLGRLVRAFGL